MIIKSMDQAQVKHQFPKDLSLERALQRNASTEDIYIYIYIYMHTSGLKHIQNNNYTTTNTTNIHIFIASYS